MFRMRAYRVVILNKLERVVLGLDIENSRRDLCDSPHKALWSYFVCLRPPLTCTHNIIVIRAARKEKTNIRSIASQRHDWEPEGRICDKDDGLLLDSSNNAILVVLLNGVLIATPMTTT